LNYRSPFEILEDRIAPAATHASANPPIILAPPSSRALPAPARLVATASPPASSLIVKEATTTVVSGNDPAGTPAEGGGYVGGQKPGPASNGFRGSGEPSAFQSTISGVVFADANGDGSQEESEAGLPHHTVILEVKHNGHYVKVSTTDTDEHGNYSFCNLPPGAYRVRLLNASPAEQTHTSYEVELGQGTHVSGKDFAVIHQRKASQAPFPARFPAEILDCIFDDWNAGPTPAETALVALAGLGIMPELQAKFHEPQDRQTVAV
jgi:hypothetical protein